MFSHRQHHSPRFHSSAQSFSIFVAILGSGSLSLDGIHPLASGTYVVGADTGAAGEGVHDDHLRGSVFDLT